MCMEGQNEERCYDFCLAEYLQKNKQKKKTSLRHMLVYSLGI